MAEAPRQSLKLSFEKENIEQLKEPKAFLKVVQFFCSMISFACIVSFRFQSPPFLEINYPESYGTKKSAAIFLVFTGVTCWLYSGAALAVYLVLGRNLNDIVAIVDFAMSCVYALFW